MSESGDDDWPLKNLEAHRYQQLTGGSHIRLLTLLPQADTHRVVSCTLSNHDVLDDECPEFEALSYVWGASKPPRPILCDNQLLCITENLDDALRALRGDEPRLLWIDQLCIDQEDSLEKNSQIPLMRDIYSRATRTIAWLGPASENLDLAFEALSKLSKSWIYFLDKHIQMGIEEEAEMEESERGAAETQRSKDLWGIEPPTRSERTALKILMYNPWFTRVWIIQEATVSKDLVVQAGQNRMPFDYMLAGMLAMLNILVPENGTRRNDLQVEGNRMLATLARVKHAYHTKPKLPATQLIAECDLFRATDDRDRFYALYGISSISSAQQPGLRADYGLPVGQALGVAMCQLMNDEQSLRMLELTDSWARSEILPSWVPQPRDVRDPLRLPLSTLYTKDYVALDAFAAVTRKICMEELEDRYEFDWDAWEAGFRSSVGSLNETRGPDRLLPQTSEFDEIHFQEDSLTLVVRGQLVDRISAELSPVALWPAGLEVGHGSFEQQSRYNQDIESFGNDIDDAQNFREMSGAFGSGVSTIGKFLKVTVDHWKKLVDAWAKIDSMVMKRGKTERYPSQELLQQAYRMVVTGGQTENDYVAKMSDLDERKIMELFVEWRRSLSTAVQIDGIKSWMGIKGSSGFFSIMSTSARAHGSFQAETRTLVSELMQPLYGRRVAWTVYGRLALVPAITEPGDHILYLQGSEIPFVLRLLDGSGTWKMVGPAYVDGCMAGEGFDRDCLASVRIR